MTFQVEITPIAETQIEQAYRWYRERNIVWKATFRPIALYSTPQPPPLSLPKRDSDVLPKLAPTCCVYTVASSPNPSGFRRFLAVANLNEILTASSIQPATARKILFNGFRR